MIIQGYQDTEKVYESPGTLIFRAYREQDRQPVILKLLNEEYPSPEQLARFRQEYEITKLLDTQEIKNLCGMEHYKNTLVIVFEDHCGKSLDNLMKSMAFSLGELLEIAISITGELSKIHSSGIIHRDINPSNIIYDRSARRLKIIDFGISAFASRENSSKENDAKNNLEGTLAYISPEQTGRISRTHDFRTDFYSLGVSLFELFARRLPFETTDSMEMIHCHIARQAPCLREINSKIPEPVSDIIMKLMAKNPEDRYQSTQGIEHDLRECLEQFQARGEISCFPLGQKDLSGKLQIPEKFYGRENEIKVLMQSFDHTMQGKNEIVLVSGYSGVGKTSLVNKFYQHLRDSRKYGDIRFISGKFDQFQRNIPYSAVISAFTDMIRQILAQSEEQISQLRKKLLSALGPNGQVIIDVIPEAELIMGPQPPLISLTPEEAQNRFILVFQDFIRVFASPEHPTILFLDNLQWADNASLKLIKLLISDQENLCLFLLGAYRDNEVDDTSPLMLAADTARKSGIPVRNIPLPPLELSHVSSFISDTLGCGPEQAKPLAELVLAKTNGNPFFTGEFLKLLYKKQLITFDFRHGRWQWDSEQIQAQSITDNLVTLMADKIRNLLPDTQNILRLAACIGSEFDADTLASVKGETKKETLRSLEQAISEGLIFEVSSFNLQVSSFRPQVSIFNFSHNRIRQAAYSLIPGTEKQAVHLQTGRLMLQNTQPDKLDKKIFDIVNQINQGVELIKSRSERDELAGLNLAAGKKAKASVAYEPALSYLQTGIRLLGEDKWQKNYDMTLELYVETAETAYLSTYFKLMEQAAGPVLEHAKTLLDKTKVYEIKIRAFIAQNKMTEAINLALKILKMLGLKLVGNPNQMHILAELVKTRLALAGKKPEYFYELPKMHDLHKVAVTRILSIVGHAAYIAVPNLMPIIVLKAVRLSAKYGNASFSTYAYTAYGLILCAFLNEVEAGTQFGSFSLKLLDRLGLKEFECRTVNMYNTFVRHWKEHARQTLKPLAQAYQRGLETGDLEYAAISAFAFAGYSFWVGRNLEIIEKEIKEYIPSVRRLRQETPLRWYEMVWQAVLNLAGRSDDPCSLAGKSYDERKMLPVHIENNDRVGICYLHFLKLFLCYLFRDYHKAVENSVMAEKYMEGQLSTMTVPIFHCYDSLARLALYHGAPGKEKKRILRKVAKNQKKLKKIASYAPMNHLHKWHMVEAELAKNLGNDLQAMNHFKQAARLAGKNRYIQDQAVANELAARFYLSGDNEKIARVFMKEAHYCYTQWGATAKVRDLEEKEPHLLGAGTADSHAGSVETTTDTVFLTASGRGISQTLDLKTVMKSSNAISGEIVLENLLKKMMQIVMENAGAQKGCLILEKDGQFMIQARGTADTGDTEVMQSVPMSDRTHGTIPSSLFNYVVNTREKVVLNDASNHGDFTDDPYIVHSQPKSVMCIPLVNQGKLAGILYLENNLTTGAFTPDRLELLSLLSSQMAISIENADLYQNLREAARKLEEYSRTLEQKVEERTEELNRKNTELNLTVKELEDINRKIMASIRYAGMIQKSLLLNTGELKNYLPDSFTIWLPRDAVGGDIVYSDFTEKGIIVGVFDCTGHGVPGAFMTIIATSGLRKIIKDGGCHDPAQILKKLNSFVKTTLRQDTDQALSDDGLDAGICFLDIGERILTYAGAKRPLLYIRNSKADTIKGDRESIGYKKSNLSFSFTNHTVNIEKGMSFYMFTDGMTDQLGGKKRLRFGTKRLTKLLEAGAELPFEKQEEMLIQALDEYRGERERVDDVTVVGFGF
ncbi:MAG: AAA family ATPase [Desulfobacterales bacterium]|nr:AAA family ATPase [Desulfobacterales bacterium]